jgi:hypothetical protein
LHNLFVEVNSKYLNVLLDKPARERFTESAETNNEHATTISCFDFSAICM